MSSRQWAKLRRHRDEAERYPLSTLIWGPSDDGSLEYQTRCDIRDRLIEEGHDAQFSEDLAGQPGALPDPIDDEALQADSADLIVMIYGSRGTQTEADVILSKPNIALKAVILIEQGIAETVLTKALASEAWQKTKKHARVIEYESSDLADKISTVVEVTREVRRACYVRDLRFRGVL